jgi:flagellar protein FliT
MHRESEMEQRTPADIIEAYEHLAEVTARMRAAATQEDWDSVIALESECASVYTRLASIETGVAGDAAYQRRKSELICKLLEDDAQIRERVSGQAATIWRLIDGKPRVAQLNAAYGSESGK